MSKLDIQVAVLADYAVTMAASKAYPWVSKSKVKPHVFAAIQEAIEARKNRAHITRRDKADR